MAYLAPNGPVYQAGTLAGNPIAATAGLTTLRLCDDAVYRHVDAAASDIGVAASKALSEAGVAHRLQAAGNLFSIFFLDEDVTNYDTAKGQEVFRYRDFFHSMLSQGVYLPPSAFEAWFVSSAHDDEALNRVFDALPAAARAAASAQENPGT